MSRRRISSLPTGKAPWDPLNGLRIGALAGGLLGASTVALIGSGGVWVVLTGAAAGGAIGYWTQKRQMSDRDG